MSDAWGHFYDSALRQPLDRIYARVHGPTLWAVGWVVAVLGLVNWRSGKEAIFTPTPLGVAAGGAALMFVAGKLWTSRIQPLVLVATFQAVGSSHTSEEAEAIRDRIVEALRERADLAGQRPSLVARPISHVVDPGDPREHVGRAKSTRAPVLIAGKVRMDAGQWLCTVRVITTGEQMTWRPKGSDAVRITLPTAEFEKHGEVARQEISSLIAATATLALGLAFLAKGNYKRARQLLDTEVGTSALSMFYAGLAAFMMEDFEAALSSAARSWSSVPFRPTAALAAASAFQAGQPDLGREWIERRNGQPSAPGEWAQLVADLEPLASAHAIVDILDTLMSKMDESTELFRLASEQLMKRPVDLVGRDSIREALLQKDYATVIAALTPPPGPAAPYESAMLAVAAARMGQDNAPELVLAAEEALTASSNHLGADQVAEAYAVLGDPTSFGRAWEWQLEQALHGTAATHTGLGPDLVRAHVATAKRKFQDVVPPGFWEHPHVARVTERYLTLADKVDDESSPVPRTQDGHDGPAGL